MRSELETPGSAARQLVLGALNRDPFDVWTRDALASRLAIPSSVVGRVLAELVGAGLIRRLEGPDEEYTAAGAY
jgi:hypothetical protein